MEGSSIKLAFLLLLVANASVLTAEARCNEHKPPHGPKHLRPPPPPAPLPAAPTPAPSGIPPYEIHGCGHNCTDSNDCDSPCTVCCSDNTCCYEEPTFLPPSPPPTLVNVQEPAPAPIDVGDEPSYFPQPESPAGAPIDVGDEPSYFPEPESPAGAPIDVSEGPADFPQPQSPAGAPTDVSDGSADLSPSSPAPAPAPVDVDDTPEDFPPTLTPYQVHGCGYKCNDSNDCDWPCTECCYHSYNNHTCCYEQPFP